MPEADSSPDPKPTPRLGSYLLVKALGSGGMSNVFRAVHEETGSVVAVKVLPRTLAKNATLLQRFMREAKSAEALDHPNVVAIYDRGFDQGRHYLVLEFVEGRDLHDRVRLNGPLGAQEAVGFIREVAEGLRYASAQGMIHRDVKPANLLMTPDGHAKIIDLGLALQIEDEDERVTRDGTTVGTVDYMAPEQARDSRQTSERSDIYSLGCTFYYLLTGSPPYPGGGLSDKLARHYKAPIPNVRDHRPDVPESLASLIRKMMEKKPENRFADYTQLIEALDTLGDHPTQDSSEAPLDALIVDDDDEFDEIGLAPTESALDHQRDGRPPSSLDHLLMAEIVDDDDEDDLPPPTLPAPGPRPRSRELPQKPKPVAPAAPAELSLAELAALDADDPPPARKTPQRPSSSITTSVRAASDPSQAVTRPAAAPIAAITEDDGEEVYGAEGPARRGSGPDLPLKTWIAAGVMVGLSIAIVGFAASMLISFTRPEPPVESNTKPLEEASNRESSDSSNTVVIRPIRPTGPAIPKKKEVVVPKPEPVAEVVAEVAGPPEEKPYPPEWEAKFAPPPVSRPVVIPENPRIVVRRVLQSGNEPQTPSIAAAFSRSNDLVEIADTGPFFEDDCQVAGKTRLIRARGGIRPMIKVEFTENPIIKGQVAKFVLGKTNVDHLVFEGIDFAVNVRDLPDTQNTLFLCQGVDLTLRDCSLTILNANDAARPYRFSVFRVEEGTKPNRIVLERTTIRGPVGTLVDMTASRADLVFSRSLILGDLSPLIVVQPVEKSARSIHYYRSLLATRGHILEFAGRPNPLTVRSLGTMFARIEGSKPTSPGLFSARMSFPGEPPTVLDWLGEDNDFIGWTGLLTSGTDEAVRVSGVDGIKTNWPGSDESSRESPTPWQAPVRPDELVPADFVRLAPIHRATLSKIATPHPRLRDLTFFAMARLPTPELSATLIPPYVPPKLPAGGNAPAPAVKAAVPRPNPNATGPVPKGPALKKAGPQLKGLGPPAPGLNAQGVPDGPLNLTFDVKEEPWRGDLGLYLAEKLVKGTTRATITIRGSGVSAMSPIRLPDGLSITILGEPNQPLPIFYPKPEAAGRAMFELHGGDLALADLAFTTENSTRPRHWVLSEDGILAIRHCRFRDPAPNSSAASSASVGPIIAFLAKGTAPITPRVGPLVKETDRPTARLKNCLIWTASEAISAEVGRGVVDLDNCLIISSGPAFTLLPRDVSRDKFEADLVLERCTIAVDKTGVVLGPMAGEPTGPNRPWLVSTRRCAFPRTQPPGGAGALLQVDPDAMARGVLFWQSSSDIYDCHHFLTSSGPHPASFPGIDIKKQWHDLWGAEHTKGDQGPTARRPETVLRYKDRERPKPGKVVPAALELDAAMSELGVDFKQLP